MAIQTVVGQPPNRTVTQYQVEVLKQTDAMQKDPPEYRFSNGRNFDRQEGRGVYNANPN